MYATAGIYPTALRQTDIRGESWGKVPVGPMPIMDRGERKELDPMMGRLPDGTT